MVSRELIERTRAFIEEKFADDATGHDYWHMYRVWRLAQQIAATEPKANTALTELAALLHDIADWKFHKGDEEAGPRAARQWLKSQSADETDIAHVEEIIRTVSFKGAGVPPAMTTLEGKIVSDADKLDALGAVGIGRAFAYGGSKQRPMYDPNVKPELHVDFEAYKNSRGGNTVNHFYEKLLLLKDRLYTDEAKKLAQRRHKYMETFLEEFYDEWDGRH